MEDLIIPKTKQSPEVKFSIKNHLFYIEGSCRPENIEEFSSPIYSWLEKKDIKNAIKDITFIVDLFYFNSSSAKFLITLLLKIKELSHNSMNVLWKYEEDDEDLLEAGKEFANIVKANFEFHAKP